MRFSFCFYCLYTLGGFFPSYLFLLQVEQWYLNEWERMNEMYTYRFGYMKLAPLRPNDVTGMNLLPGFAFFFGIMQISFEAFRPVSSFSVMHPNFFKST